MDQQEPRDFAKIRHGQAEEPLIREYNGPYGQSAPRANQRILFTLSSNDAEFHYLDGQPVHIMKPSEVQECNQRFRAAQCDMENAKHDIDGLNEELCSARDEERTNNLDHRETIMELKKAKADIATKCLVIESRDRELIRRCQENEVQASQITKLKRQLAAQKGVSRKAKDRVAELEAAMCANADIRNGFSEAVNLFIDAKSSGAESFQYDGKTWNVEALEKAWAEGVQ